MVQFIGLCCYMRKCSSLCPFHFHLGSNTVTDLCFRKVLFHAAVIHHISRKNVEITYYQIILFHCIICADIEQWTKCEENVHYIKRPIVTGVVPCHILVSWYRLIYILVALFILNNCMVGHLYVNFVWRICCGVFV